MSKRSFIAPLPLLVATLVGSNNATASMNENSESLKQDSQIGKQNSISLKIGEISTYRTGDDIFAFVLNKNENGIMVAGHYSHSSHASHSSHSSHYSSR